MSDIRNRYGNFIGRGLVDHSTKRFWLNIPKNASNSLIDFLHYKSGWKNANYFISPEIQDYHKVVYLKDPIKRWRGCTIELCHHFIQHNKLFQQDFNEKVFLDWFKNKEYKNFDRSLDLHHLRQIDYMHKMNLDNVTYVNMEEGDLENKTQAVFGINKKLIVKNATNTIDNKIRVAPYVDELMLDKIFLQKLHNFYIKDYELIRDVFP